MAKTHATITTEVTASQDAVRDLVANYYSNKIADDKLKEQSAELFKKLKGHWEDVEDGLKADPTAVTQPQADELKKSIDGIQSRLELFENPAFPFRDNRKAHYTEAGNWARHFSNVRMTVMTFTITICGTLIAWKWQAGGPPANSLVIPVAILWSTGVIVFWAFTWHTYDQIRRQQLKRPLLPSRFNDKRDANQTRFDGASLVIPVISCVLIALIKHADFKLASVWVIGLALFLAAGVVVPVGIWHRLNHQEERFFMPLLKGIIIAVVLLGATYVYYNFF